VRRVCALANETVLAVSDLALVFNEVARKFKHEAAGRESEVESLCSSNACKIIQFPLRRTCASVQLSKNASTHGVALRKYTTSGIINDLAGISQQMHWKTEA
jgi:hypothetical protein